MGIGRQQPDLDGVALNTRLANTFGTRASSFSSPKVPVGINFNMPSAQHMRTMSKRLDPPHESSIDSDDIDKAPIGEIFDGIGVCPDTSSCGGSRMCMLSDVASSGLAPAEFPNNNSTTIEPGRSAQLSVYVPK